MLACGHTLLCYLCVSVVERHQGGVDDLAIHVCRLTLPLPDWLMGVDPVVQLVSASAPQYPLQTQTWLGFAHVNQPFP